jgi:hypothetical protein
MTGGFSVPLAFSRLFSGLCEGAAPLVGQHQEVSWSCFFFSCFPWSDGLSVTSRSSEVVLQNDWLVSSIWFLLSTGQVEIGICDSSLVFFAILITSQGLHFNTKIGLSFNPIKKNSKGIKFPHVFLWEQTQTISKQ